ncbi:MAG: hypothetical protein HY855_20025 [Burkholderiales bacterium]|nr:hypothetical protein [Burkholderiales bacterium]
MNPPDPDLYLVRVWRGASFRAIARRVDEETQHCLNSPEALAAYLAAGDSSNDPGAALPPRHQATPPAAADRENTP